MLELDAGFRVETGGGLVHDQDLRVVEQRAAEADALGHAFGELVGKPLRQRDEIGEVHDLLDALAAFLAFVAERAGVEIQIFEHRHVLVVSEVVGHPADEFSHFRRVVDHVDAADFGRAERRIVQGGEDAHGGGFPRAVGPDEATDRAVGNLEGDAVDGLEIAEVAVEIVDLESGHGEMSG